MLEIQHSTTGFVLLFCFLFLFFFNQADLSFLVQDPNLPFTFVCDLVQGIQPLQAPLDCWLRKSKDHFCLPHRCFLTQSTETQFLLV
jgi:hypothetical protein